jgi:hypothetical protein
MDVDLTHYENELLRLHRVVAHQNTLLRQAQETLSRVAEQKPESGEHDGEDRHDHDGGDEQP